MKTIDKMIALMTLLFAFSATAQQPLASKEDVMTRISLGTLSGTAKERVYDTDEGGRKLSELDWRYRHAVVVQALSSGRCGPGSLSVRPAGQLSRTVAARWMITTGSRHRNPDGPTTALTLIRGSISLTSGISI